MMGLQKQGGLKSRVQGSPFGPSSPPNDPSRSGADTAFLSPASSLMVTSFSRQETPASLHRRRPKGAKVFDKRAENHCCVSSYDGFALEHLSCVASSPRPCLGSRWGREEGGLEQGRLLVHLQPCLWAMLPSLSKAAVEQLSARL